MKVIRLVTESGKHIYDVELPHEFVAIPGSYIFHGTDIWQVLREDVYTANHPEGPRLEYIVK